MKKLTVNELANQIVKKEGKKKSVSVAQVKEILAILGCLIKQNPLEVMGVLIGYAKKK